MNNAIQHKHSPLSQDNNELIKWLLEGDVGSGKTVVAALVGLNAVLEKKQVVVMAPTEILARQHSILVLHRATKT